MTTCINNGNVLNIKWPEPNCETAFTETEIKQNVKEEIFKK